MWFLEFRFVHNEHISRLGCVEYGLLCFCERGGGLLLFRKRVLADEFVEQVFENKLVCGVALEMDTCMIKFDDYVFGCEVVAGEEELVKVVVKHLVVEQPFVRWRNDGHLVIIHGWKMNSRMPSTSKEIYFCFYNGRHEMLGIKLMCKWTVVVLVLFLTWPFLFILDVYYPRQIEEYRYIHRESECINAYCEECYPEMYAAAGG